MKNLNLNLNLNHYSPNTTSTSDSDCQQTTLVISPPTKKQSAQIILTFFSSTLYDSDIRLLNPSKWINDAIIEFYFEYLNKSQIPHPQLLSSLSLLQDKTTFNQDSSMIFVSPATTQMAKFLSKSDLAIILRDLSLSSYASVVFPINDHSLTTAQGGSHWSLLSWNKSSDSFFHFDSFGNSNQKFAKDIADIFSPLLHASPTRKFYSPKVPFQQNSFDCGIFTLYFASLLKHHRHDISIFKSPNSFKFSPQSFRTTLIELIRTLSKSKLRFS